MDICCTTEGGFLNCFGGCVLPTEHECSFICMKSRGPGQLNKVLSEKVSTSMDFCGVFGMFLFLGRVSSAMHVEQPSI